VSAFDALRTTRRSLHAVAEQLLAGPQHRRTGSIRLRVVDDGIATAVMPGEPSRLAVDATTLVADRRGGQLTVPLSGTIAEIGDKLGVAAGPPVGVYDDGSGTDPTFLVVVDEAAARELLQAFRWGDAALRGFATAHATGAPEEPVLWPEHFDVAITMDEVNYGVSPGDHHIAEPYAYVGPWQQRQGAFWNQPFGTAHPVRELGSAQAVQALFDEGRSAAAADPAA
jgi:hypothetical protein